MPWPQQPTKDIPLPDLSNFGMRREDPPPHIVPELSLVDKFRVLVQFPENWFSIRMGIKESTAKTCAKQIRDGTYPSLARLRPIPEGMFDAVAGEDEREVGPENYTVWAIYHTAANHERYFDQLIRQQRELIAGGE